MSALRSTKYFYRMAGPIGRGLSVFPQPPASDLGAVPLRKATLCSSSPTTIFPASRFRDVSPRPFQEEDDETQNPKSRDAVHFLSTPFTNEYRMDAPSTFEPSRLASVPSDARSAIAARNTIPVRTPVDISLPLPFEYHPIASPLPNRPYANIPIERTTEESGESQTAGGTVPGQETKLLGTAFKIQWIRVDKLPFIRTRHLRNSWNNNRQIKVSRDGTELDPDVGRQLLEEWRLPDPAPVSRTNLSSRQTQSTPSRTTRRRQSKTSTNVISPSS